jgi:DNA-binding transcriptional regulator YiaG
MYHYVECGLPNVFLKNGYEHVDTPHGPAVAIRDVERLHAAIAWTLVEDKPWLTGPEVRFIRKFLDLTQAQLGELLGVEDQSVRRWERLGRVPRAADHALRLVFRDLRDEASARPLPDLVRRLAEAESPEQLEYRFRPRAKERRWAAAA